MNKQFSRRLCSGEDGFGLIEIVVSMFLLAALALAILPLLIQGLTQSAANATLASATQYVNERIALAQSLAPSCSAVRTLDTTAIGGVKENDSRGRDITVVTTVAPCVAGVRTVRVEIIARNADNSPLSTAATLVLVNP